MDLMDISYVDVNELGVRPFNWTGDENEIDFDDISNGYFDKDKLNDLQSSNGKNLTNDGEDNAMLDEENGSYEIDPETGNSKVYSLFYQKKTG